MTDRIALDFIAHRRWPWFGLLFLLLACAALAVVLFEWRAAQQANDTLEATIAQHGAAQRRQRAVQLAAQTQPDPQVQIRQRSEAAITAQLDYPWNRVLGDIEQASANNVALLAMTHDQVGGVQLAVEARELPEVLEVVDRLNGDAPPVWYVANYQAQAQNNPPTLRADIVKKAPRQSR
jgi:hypothetical protein